MVKKVKDLNKMSFAELSVEIKRLGKLKEEVKNKKPKGMTYCVIRTYSAGVFAGLIKSQIPSRIRTAFPSEEGEIFVSLLHS